MTRPTPKRKPKWKTEPRFPAGPLHAMRPSSRIAGIAVMARFYHRHPDGRYAKG